MFEELLFIWFCKVSVYCLVVMPFVLTSVVQEDLIISQLSLQKNILDFHFRYRTQYIDVYL